MSTLKPGDTASTNARPRKLLLRALAGEVTERPPIWLMRQAGRYLPEYKQTRERAGGMLSLCNTPEHAAEVTLQPLRRFPLDAAILFSDLPQLAAALGQKLAYHEGDGPVLDPPIRSSDDVQRLLSVTRLHEVLSPIYETVRLLTKAMPDNVTLIGYAGAPWTVACYMVAGRAGSDPEHGAVKRWALGDPQSFARLLELLIEATIEYLDRQIHAGVEVIQLFDTWAGILPEPFFRMYCVEPVAAIIRALRAKHPDVPVIAFPRGAGLLYRGYAEATGANALGLDPTVPLEWATQAVQRELGRAVQGNLDPQLLIVGGAPMRDDAERILKALSGGPFVFNLGHGISPLTPPEHVDALVKQVVGWRSRSVDIAG
jgi:uroporphyrinogen decarboxylase